MRLNSMLATVLIFLCSLVISSCSNDELAPISLKNRETANIKLNYPNNQTYSFPLQGGDGNYEISCDKPEIIETKMISSCDISIKALALGEAIITVRDQSGNTLDIHVIVDYYTDNYIVSKQDIFLTGDLKDSEKQTIKEKALATIPVKIGGGYKFIYTDAEIARGKVLVYQEKFGDKAIEGSFERKSNEIENEQWGTRHIISFDLTLPEQPKRTFIISEYIPSSRTSPIVLMAFFEDLKKTFTVDYPTVEQVYTEQVLTVPSHLYY